MRSKELTKERGTNLASVLVNQQNIHVNLPLSVAGLLETLKLRGGPVAVERNEQLVPGNQLETTWLLDGDRLEVVSLTGGG